MHAAHWRGNAGDRFVTRSQPAADLLPGPQDTGGTGEHEQQRSELRLRDTLAQVTAENAELVVQRCGRSALRARVLYDRELMMAARAHMRSPLALKVRLTLWEKHCRDSALLQADMLQTQLTALEAALKASVQRGTTLSAQLQARADQ